MPFKHNAAGCHHIGKAKFKLTNWAEYEAGLRRRESLTLWITSEALSSWQAPKRKTRGGQPRYSDLAIQTSLTLGLVFGLRLRQTEGFLTSVLQLMGLDLALPDHTTLSRRARTWRSAGRREHRYIPRKRPFTSSSTVLGSKSTALASGWRRSTVPNPVEAGANCIWHWMMIAATSSLTS